MGWLYLSAAPTYHASRLHVSQYATFPVYLVADVDYFQLGLYEQQSVNGVREWEASVQVPAAVLVMGRVIPQPGAVDVGAGDDNWIVALPSMLAAFSTPEAVVRYDCLVLEDVHDLWFSVGPPSPSRMVTFPGHTATPAWLEWADSGECAGPCWREFRDAGPEASLALNCISCPPDCTVGSYPHVTAPIEGEQLLAGSVYRIEWFRTSMGPVSEILFSGDDGRSWEPLAQLTEDLGYFDWIVPHRFTNRARLSVAHPCTDGARFSIVPGVVPAALQTWGALKALYPPH